MPRGTKRQSLILSKIEDFSSFSEDKLDHWNLLERVFFSEIFSEAWDQNTLHCLPEKGYYSIARIASVRYLQAEDCTWNSEYLITYFFIILV